MTARDPIAMLNKNDIHYLIFPTLFPYNLIVERTFSYGTDDWSTIH